MSQSTVHIYDRESRTLLMSSDPDSAPAILENSHVVGYRVNAGGKRLVAFRERNNCLGCVENDGNFETIIAHLRRQKNNSRIIFVAVSL